MAQQVYFAGKIVKLPGTYATLISGIEREIPLASYSNILLIDAGASKGGNSYCKGIVGNGKECIYDFQGEDEANYFLKGPLAPVVDGLFNPNTKNNRPGISRLFYLKAAKTTPALIRTSNPSIVKESKVKKNTIFADKTLNNVVNIIAEPSQIEGYGYNLIVKFLISDIQYEAQIEVASYVYDSTTQILTYNSDYTITSTANTTTVAVATAQATSASRTLANTSLVTELQNDNPAYEYKVKIDFTDNSVDYSVITYVDSYSLDSDTHELTYVSNYLIELQQNTSYVITVPRTLDTQNRALSNVLSATEVTPTEEGYEKRIKVKFINSSIQFVEEINVHSYSYDSNTSTLTYNSDYSIEVIDIVSPNYDTRVNLFNAISIDKLVTKEEGEACNTLLSGGKLRQGFQLKAIYDDTIHKAYLEIWKGTYLSTSISGYTIGNLLNESEPVCIYRSKKCSTPDELITFLQNDNNFKSYLIATNIVKLSSSFDTSMVSTIFNFEGGSDVYEENLNNVLDKVIDVDYSCMIILEEDDKQTMVNQALNHVLNDAKGIKQIATYEAEKADAVIAAQNYDSDSVICCAGVIKTTSQTSPTGFITNDAMYTVAKCVGRIFGLSPEIPATMKDLEIDGLEVEPSDKDLEDCLDSGVIMPYFDSDLNAFVLSQAVNTLQENTELVNPDCSTYSIQAKRILAQVVKNLVSQSKIDFWRGDKPVNKSTLSDAYVKAWTETLLSKLTVASNKTDNNYLLTYEVTKVVTDGDSKKVHLAVTVNGEITKIFFFVTVLG